MYSADTINSNDGYGRPTDMYTFYVSQTCQDKKCYRKNLQRDLSSLTIMNHSIADGGDIVRRMQQSLYEVFIDDAFLFDPDFAASFYNVHRSDTIMTRVSNKIGGKVREIYVSWT